MKKIFNSEKVTLKLFAVILIVSLFMVVGYSAANQELLITGTSKITTPEYSIIIKDIAVSSSLNGAYTTNMPTYTNTETAMYTSLPNLNSSILYTVVIKNNGLTKGVLNHTFSNIDNSDIKYKIGGIANGNILKPGDEVAVTIELSYWDNVTEVTNNSASLLTLFEFVRYNEFSDDCTLAWDGSSTSAPITRNIYGTNYYEISNANEYAWYVNYLNSTSNDAKAFLTNNICLNSKEISQVNAFTGELDGQNRTISGYFYSVNNSSKKDDTYVYGGMFKDNSGVIKGVNLSGSLSDIHSLRPSNATTPRVYDYIGAFAAINNGKIINSSFSGSMSGSYETITNCWVVTPVQRNYFGAMAGQNMGIIDGCYNKGIFNIDVISYRTACTYERESKVNVGGIVGSNFGYITDSYNNAALTINADVDHGYYYLWYGGVVGDLEGGRVLNSYNSGAVSHITDVTSSDEYYYIGGAIGNSIGTIVNTYYLDSCGASGDNGTMVSSNDLLQLNINIGNYYRKDIRNINSGYPVLKWQN